MNGVVLRCLKEVCERLGGREKFLSALSCAWEEPYVVYLPEIPDERFFRIVRACVDFYGVKEEEFYELLAAHWLTSFAPREFPLYFPSPRSAPEFLKEIDEVHRSVKLLVPDANPPRFQYEETEEGMRMRYISSRKLFPLFVALSRAAAEIMGGVEELVEEPPDAVFLRFS